LEKCNPAEERERETNNAVNSRHLVP
jgi:hypothetical protein